METIRTIRTVLTVAILLSTLLPGASFLASIFGINPHSLQIHPVAAANLNNFLGFDCAYGANGDGLPFPTSITASAPYTGVDTDNSLESVCQATELADQDGFAHPLLGDNPGIVAAGSGGGITVDIVITTLNTTINGYDLTVGYDTKVLNAVKVDQTGLPFGGNTACPGTPPSSCTLQTANSIDQTNGIVRVAQALLGVSLGPGSVTCNTVSDPSCNTANQELFRIRFDIVGAGNSALTIPAPGGTDVITNPTTVKHNDLPGAVSTDSLFDLIDVVTGIGYSASFTFSPNPEVPGSPLTFTATAACTACTGALTFSWAFATLDNVYPATPYVIQATGPTVTFTAPPPVIYRVALTVTDGAAHTALAVRSLPIRAAFSGTNALSQGVPGGSWSGSWLGGVVTGTSGYAGTWRFCPGTALSHPVCSVGPLTAPLTQNPPSITQTASQGAITYNFAGLYTAFLSIHDTAEAQLGTLPTTIVSPFQINVTSATPTFAYTVATVPNATTLTLPNAAVNVTATVAYAGTYPLASQSSTFSYIFNWGDGLQTSVTGGKAVFGIHTYTSAGSFVIKVIAKETSASAAPTAIQENGFTAVTVGSGGFTFTVAASPGTLPITQEGSATETLSATLTAGVAAPVTFSLSTLPGGLSVVFVPNPPTCTPAPTCSVSAMISASPTSVVGTFTITVTGTSGSSSATTTFNLTISPTTFAFTLSTPSPSSLSVAQGGTSPSSMITATLTAGVTTPVTFSVTSMLPTGVTATFINNACSPTCTVTISFMASPTATLGTTTVSIQAMGGGATQATSLSLTVTQPTQDTDGDGIFDNVDTQPTVFSNDFSDISLGGTTFGTISSRGNQCVGAGTPSSPCQLTVQEASMGAGILITSGPSGGLDPATISVCGGASILSVPANTQLTVKCGTVTITVLMGTVGVTFVGSGSFAGVTGTATISAGISTSNSITFDPTTFSFTAPSTNTTTIVVTVNGQTVSVAPGQTTNSPFAIFTVTPNSGAQTGQVLSVGIGLKFDARASFSAISNEPITTYTWNFGDGNTQTLSSAQTTHTYATAGTFVVTLTVTDKLGNQGMQSQTLNILPAPIMGSVSFFHTLTVTSGKLVQNVTVQVTNPNAYPILVNVQVTGTCDTVCFFSVQSGPVLIGAGQTTYITLLHTFSSLDQGQTFVMQVTLTFTSNTSNTNVSTYTLAASRTFSFRIK